MQRYRERYTEIQREKFTEIHREIYRDTEGDTSIERVSEGIDLITKEFQITVFIC